MATIERTIKQIESNSWLVTCDHEHMSGVSVEACSNAAKALVREQFTEYTPVLVISSEIVYTPHDKEERAFPDSEKVSRCQYIINVIAEYTVTIHHSDGTSHGSTILAYSFEDAMVATRDLCPIGSSRITRIDISVSE